MLAESERKTAEPRRLANVGASRPTLSIERESGKKTCRLCQSVAGRCAPIDLIAGASHG
jgi:hypothetical protein